VAKFRACDIVRCLGFGEGVVRDVKQYPLEDPQVFVIFAGGNGFHVAESELTLVSRPGDKVEKPKPMDIEKVIAAVLAEARKVREDAGYGGRMDDGGASKLEDQVNYYRYGMTRTLPPDWGTFAEQVEREEDPEYAEYLRLQKKFGE